MTKIQLSQLIAILILVMYVAYSYRSDYVIEWLFYFIAAINILLWVLRLRERKQTKS